MTLKGGYKCYLPGGLYSKCFQMSEGYAITFYCHIEKVSLPTEGQSAGMGSYLGVQQTSFGAQNSSKSSLN